jgi:hypothetical protein
LRGDAKLRVTQLQRQAEQALVAAAAAKTQYIKANEESRAAANATEQAVADLAQLQREKGLPITGATNPIKVATPPKAQTIP